MHLLTPWKFPIPPWWPFLLSNIFYISTKKLFAKKLNACFYWEQNLVKNNLPTEMFGSLLYLVFTGFPSLFSLFRVWFVWICGCSLEEGWIWISPETRSWTTSIESDWHIYLNWISWRYLIFSKLERNERDEQKGHRYDPGIAVWDWTRLVIFYHIEVGN